jgi:hypothetical protein
MATAVDGSAGRTADEPVAIAAQYAPAGISRSGADAAPAPASGR